MSDAIKAFQALTLREKRQFVLFAQKLIAANEEAILDGTSGQDRESYSDTQDRDSYSTD